MTQTSTSKAQHSPITLAFLFYLVTFGAIVSACLRPLSQNQTVTTESLSRLATMGAGIGLFIGMALGLFMLRSFLSLIAAGALGLLIGAIAGALAMVEASHFVEIITIACLGSWLMIVCMTIAARLKHETN